MYACMHNIIVTFLRQSRVSLKGNVVLSGECNKDLLDVTPSNPMPHPLLSQPILLHVNLSSKFGC